MASVEVATLSVVLSQENNIIQPSSRREIDEVAG
jgi:hypothetical protein